MRTTLKSNGPIRRSRLWTSASLVGALGIATLVSACDNPYPVNSPCGVIVDDLQGVNATTRDGNRRLADHYERGIKAGCWTRTPANDAKLKKAQAALGTS